MHPEPAQPHPVRLVGAERPLAGERLVAGGPGHAGGRPQRHPLGVDVERAQPGGTDALQPTRSGPSGTTSARAARTPASASTCRTWQPARTPGTGADQRRRPGALRPPRAGRAVFVGVPDVPATGRTEADAARPRHADLTPATAGPAGSAASRPGRRRCRTPGRVSRGRTSSRSTAAARPACRCGRSAPATSGRRTGTPPRPPEHPPRHCGPPPRRSGPPARP